MKRARAFVCGLSAALMCMSTGAPPSAADERVVTGGTNCELADPASASATSLTVRKMEPNPYDEVPSGELPYGTVEGMRFTLDKVNVPYATREDAQGAAQMSLGEAEQRGFGVSYTAETNSSGEARFEGVSPGLYRLRETVPVDGKYNYRQSGDMLLLLPLVSGRGCTVQYDSVLVAKPATMTPEEGGELSSTASTTPKVTEQTTPNSEPESTPRTHHETSPQASGTKSSQSTRSTTRRTAQGGATETTARTTSPNSPAWLAQTGANVLATVGLGALLVVLGIWLTARKRGGEQ